MTRCPSCGARLAAPKSAANDEAAWRAFVTAWWSRFGAAPVSARELHQLPEAQAVHEVMTVFARRLGAARRSGALVDGHRVVLSAWQRPGPRRTTLPALWALEGAP